MKTGIKASDAMTKEPIKIDSKASIKECTKVMLNKGVGGLIIKENDKPIGIVTEKDIVRAVAGNIDSKRNVKEIMTRNLIGVDPDTDIYDAILKMKERDVRRLPVVRNGKLVGLLTEKDILKIEPHLFDLIVEKYKIREEEDKPIYLKLSKGRCENCGEEGNLTKIKGSLICEFCREII